MIYLSQYTPSNMRNKCSHTLFNVLEQEKKSKLFLVITFIDASFPSFQGSPDILHRIYNVQQFG